MLIIFFSVMETEDDATSRPILQSVRRRSSFEEPSDDTSVEDIVRDVSSGPFRSSYASSIYTRNDHGE